MNRLQTQVYAACLTSLCDLPDSQMAYALQILTAQAQGKVLSTLAQCLSELDRLSDPQERAEVLRQVRGMLENKADTASMSDKAAPSPSPVISLHKTNQKRSEEVKKTDLIKPRDILDAYEPTRGKTLKEVGEMYGINFGTLHSRLAHGWTLEEALTRPIRAEAK